MSNREGRISLVSHEAELRIGQTSSTLTGTPIRDLFPDPLWAQAVERLSREDHLKEEWSPSRSI